MNNTKYKVRVLGDNTTYILDYIRDEIFEDMGDHTKITLFITYEFKEFEQFANKRIQTTACKRYHNDNGVTCTNYKHAYIASYEKVPMNSMFDGSKIVIEAYV